MTEEGKSTARNEHHAERWSMPRWAARCSRDHQLWGRSELRFGDLALLLTLYGAWSAWPRIAKGAVPELHVDLDLAVDLHPIANATLPAINGLCVAGVVAVCLFEVYLR